MLVNNIKRTITEPERDAVIAQFAARLASTGPFREMKVVTADPSRDAADVLATAGIDMPRQSFGRAWSRAVHSAQRGRSRRRWMHCVKRWAWAVGWRSCPCSGPAGRSSPWRTPSAAESPWSISRGRRRFAAEEPLDDIAARVAATRSPSTQAALDNTARSYRQALGDDQDVHVEVWSERTRSAAWSIR